MSAVPVGVQAPLRNALIRIRARLESVPYALLAIPLRVAVATVFWNSGTTKLASWETTLALFLIDRLQVLPHLFVVTLCRTCEDEVGPSEEHSEEDQGPLPVELLDQRLLDLLGSRITFFRTTGIVAVLPASVRHD